MLVSLTVVPLTVYSSGYVVTVPAVLMAKSESMVLLSPTAVRMQPASGPYSAGSSGMVVSPSTLVPTSATRLYWPSGVTFQMSPLLAATIMSPSQTPVLSIQRLPQSGPSVCAVGELSVTQGLITVLPLSVILAISPFWPVTA